MTIDTDYYCDNKECPIKKDNIFYTTTRIGVSISDVHITLPIPCILCSHVKKTDMGKILTKSYTKDMLKK